MGESTQFGTPAPFPVRVNFERRGDKVTGSYAFGLGVGKILGTVDNNKLHSEWEWAMNTGRGVFVATQNGARFSGTWGYRESSDNAGTWNGARQ